MTIRTRSTVAVALATALVGGTQLPAGADEPEEGVHCFTQALTAEEIAAGVYSDIDCYPVSEEPPQARLLSVNLARVYTGHGGTGTALTIQDTSCTGGGVNWAPGHVWNDAISSTQLIACGSAKHWIDNNWTGATNQFVNTSVVVEMGTPMDKKTSSIEYAP